MTKVAELQIEIAANVARLTEDFSRAKSEVNRSMGHIQRDVKEQLDGVKESLKSMKEMVEAMGIAMLAEHLVEAAKSAAEFGDQIEHAAQKTGMSAESLQGLGFAAKMSDVDFQSLSVGLEHLSRAMLHTQQGSLQSASAFQSVGLSAQQLKSMSMDEVLAKVADRFHATRDGATKTALAMQLFGRSGAELIPLLDRGSEGIDALKAKAKQLGIVMSDEAVKQSAEFADKMKELSASAEATTRNLMGELMPAMNRIADAFLEGSSDGGVLKEVFRQIGEGAVWLTGFIAKLAATVEALGKTIAMVAAVVSHPMSAKSIFKDWIDDVNALQARTNRFLATLDAAPSASSPTESEGATGTGSLKVYKTSGTGNKSHMSEYEQRLAGAKIYYRQTHDLREYSKAQEIQYWQDVLNNEKVTANDRLAIERRVSSLRLEQMKKEAADRQKLAEEAIQASRDRALGEVALDEQRAQTQLQSGQITHDQLLQIRQAHEEKKYRIEVGYGLEGALNDATSKRIISEIITPRFKQGDFYGGIAAGVDRIIRVIDGEPLPEPKGKLPGDTADIQQYVPVIFILALVVGGVLRAVLGRFPGALVTGGAVAFIAWLLVGAVSVALVAGVIALFFTLLGGGMGGYGIGGRHGGFGGGGFSGGGGGASGRW